MNFNKNLDPFIIIGITISIFTSAVLILLKIETISSLLVGLLGIIISFQLDLMSKTNQLDDKLEKTIRLNKDLISDKTLFERIQDIIDSWKKIKTSNYHPIFNKTANSSLDDLNDKMKAIASGEVLVDAHDYTILTIMIEEAKDEIKSTSLASFDWWNSSIGTNYLNQNIKAKDRGVNITRVFFYNELKPELMKPIQLQKDNNINVYIAKIDNIPEELLYDFVISDDNLVCFAELNSQMQYKQHHFSCRNEDVQRMRQKFDQLLFYSEKFTQSL